jgi:hypothetical protein
VVNDGILTKITNDAINNVEIRIVKQGYTWQDCGNQARTVVLASGQSTENMMSIFNTPNPSLPQHLVACLYGSEPNGITLGVEFTFRLR